MALSAMGTIVVGGSMRLEVYLIGCAKCVRLERNLQQALRELGREDEIIRLEDIEEIKRRGVMRAPVLFIDGEVKVVGMVPGLEDLKAILSAAAEP
jgi:small redox-active disulfide protein 2